MELLQIKDLNYSVNNKIILKKVSFNLKKHGFLTLVGPSGAGKSTILKLIANLITPTSGVILYKRRDISKINPVDYRKEVSYCFQTPSLFGKTVEENLTFPYKIRKKEVDHMRLVDLLKQVDLPEEFLQKENASLSGGEKQRVALIRNLVFLPKVLLLDEVTTGLDQQSKEIVHKLIKNVHANGIAIIQVTHDQSEIEQADNILEIKKEFI